MLVKDRNPIFRISRGRSLALLPKKGFKDRRTKRKWKKNPSLSPKNLLFLVFSRRKKDDNRRRHRLSLSFDPFYFPLRKGTSSLSIDRGRGGGMGPKLVFDLVINTCNYDPLLPSFLCAAARDWLFSSSSSSILPSQSLWAVMKRSSQAITCVTLLLIWGLPRV